MGEMVATGEEVVKILKEEGVKAGFGVTSYHTESLVTLMQRYGIPTFHFRHEQSGPYAADGFSGSSGELAAAWGTAGPGAANALSAVYQAYTTMRPLIYFAGTHGPCVDKHWSLQEGHPEEFFKTAAKHVVQIYDIRTTLFEVRKACRIAKEYPPGPAVVVSSPAVVGWEQDSDVFVFNQKDRWAQPSLTQADPAEVERTVKRILSAQKPVIIAGDGVFWSKAGAELKELIEMLQIPVVGRRTARGMIPEDSPLGVGPGWRGYTQGTSDLIILIGLREGITEGMFYPPPLGPYRRDVEYIQINESEREVAIYLPTVAWPKGNIKLVLRQMIECAKTLVKTKPDRSEWFKGLQGARAKHWKEVVDKAAADKKTPIGGWSWGKEVGEWANSVGKVSVICDSFSGSYAGSDRYIARLAGSSLDTAGWSGVGNSIPQGFGVKHAHPDWTVIGLIGDGGMGLTGMDLETCVRYKKPVISVVFNNSEWIGAGWEYLYMTGVHGANKVIQDQRYDLMFEPIGVHGEFCTKAEQVKPALERAANSGKPAIVNCIVDPYFYHPWCLVFLLGGYLRWFGPQRCKEYGIYPERFWKDVVEPFPGGADGVKGTLAAIGHLVGI